MCDYSLHNVASRPARVYDKLVTTRFQNTFTRGFCTLNEPEVAVCLLPGTEVAFDQDVKCRWAIPWFPRKNMRQRVARFRQMSVDVADAHHDALEFPDGRFVMVTNLVKGQRATVLQLPAPARVATGVKIAAQAERSEVAITG